MGFSDHQMRALSRSVPKQYVRSRVREGKELSYVEGWYVLAQANRIFGFDGWDRETDGDQVHHGPRGPWHGSRRSIRLAFASRSIPTAGPSSAMGMAPAKPWTVRWRGARPGAQGGRNRRHQTRFGNLRKGVWPGALCRSQAVSRRGRATAKNGTRLQIIAPAGGRPGRRTTRSFRHRRARAGRGRSHPATDPLQACGLASLSPPTAAALTAVRQSIDKSALPLNGAAPDSRQGAPALVASQPCLLCSATPSDAHHVRFAQPRAMGRKVGDDFTVPLCRSHHRELHDSGNEAAWWHDMGIDPLEIAGELWNESHPVRVNGVPNGRRDCGRRTRMLRRRSTACGNIEKFGIP